MCMTKIVKSVVKKSVYKEIETLVTELKERRMMPDLNTFVYSRKELYEGPEDSEPRYSVSVMIKRFY